MVSLFGSWMQTTAQGYLVFELTNSPAYLGYVSFAVGVPTWLFMLYGGVIADRVSRRSLLLLTQTLMMLLAFILAGLTFTGLVQPWHIILLSLCLGTANAFDAPARLAIVPEMVDREDLTNAIALNATMFNSATALGPAVAGVTYALFGPAWCFMINGLTFLAVIGALSLIKLRPLVVERRKASAFAQLKEGLGYAISQPVIRIIISMTAVVSLFGFSFITLLPAWSVKVLGGDATTNGLLLSARGVGALISALGIASLGRFRYKGRLLTTGTIVFPFMLLLFSVVRSIPLALIILLGIGASMILVMNLSSVLMQILVEDKLRGRVMSVFSLTFFGFMPIGGLLVGFIAEYIGEPLTVGVGALVILVFAIYVRLRQPGLANAE